MSLKFTPLPLIPPPSPPLSRPFPVLDSSHWILPPSLVFWLAVLPNCRFGGADLGGGGLFDDGAASSAPGEEEETASRSGGGAGGGSLFAAEESDGEQESPKAKGKSGGAINPLAAAVAARVQKKAGGGGLFGEESASEAEEEQAEPARPDKVAISASGGLFGESSDEEALAPLAAKAAAKGGLLGGDAYDNGGDLFGDDPVQGCSGFPCLAMSLVFSAMVFRAV